MNECYINQITAKSNDSEEILWNVLTLPSLVKKKGYNSSISDCGLLRNNLIF